MMRRVVLFLAAVVVPSGGCKLDAVGSAGLLSESTGRDKTTAIGSDDNGNRSGRDTNAPSQTVNIGGQYDWKLIGMLAALLLPAPFDPLRRWHLNRRLNGGSHRNREPPGRAGFA